MPATQPAKPPLTQEELDQALAPVALYPDSLLSQLLMASTYPLEVVEADRWVKANKDLKGDALATELEKQTWDPSVKSLVNFPQTLDMMNDKLDWTVKLGDAFIGQQPQVMATVQSLRAKAQAQGNLKTNEQQKVTVEPATAGQPAVIEIEPANPQVIYVPTYNPTVIYGTWAYPAYPPVYYYPPGYVAATAAISFGVGLAVGMAWGYAWGGCDWHHGNVNINVNRNININTHINRNVYQNNYNRTNINTRVGGSTWQHDPSHREGVAYRDNTTAQRFGAGSSSQAQAARDSFRGRTDSQGFSVNGNRSGLGAERSSSGTRSGAFDGVDRSGGNARDYSQRGHASRGGGGRIGRHR
ncbi:MAG TPA: DUF3300 domain-containing protein [Tepidisphaeraceae bacterium]